MANGLYEPEDCESERTVIISELQGGENDPEQLLDTEVTATAFHAHPYRHPTIGWLSRSPVDDARRPLRPLPAVLHPEQRDARRRRRRRHRRGAAARRAPFGDIPPARCPPRVAHRRAAAARRAPRARRTEGTTAYLKLAYHAPAATDPDFFPLLVLDAVLTGRQGGEPLVVASATAAAAKRAALPRAGRARPGLVGVRGAAADRAIRSSTPSRCTASDGVAARGRRGGRAPRSSTACAASGITPAELETAPPPAARAPRVRDRQRHQHRASARLLPHDRRRRPVSPPLGRRSPRSGSTRSRASRGAAGVREPDGGMVPADRRCGRRGHAGGGGARMSDQPAIAGCRRSVTSSRTAPSCSPSRPRRTRR